MMELLEVLFMVCVSIMNYATSKQLEDLEERLSRLEKKSVWRMKN